MTMKEMQLYELWKEKAKEDDDLVKELEEIASDEAGIYDRFYRELEFGTAGLRGVIGAGSNRMNIYTVRKTTQGIAQYLNERYESASVAISYDSRIKSDLFAKEAARVLAANGIRAYLTYELMPTPMLSFAVRDYGCQVGIMITASHNPAKYNGYKVYGPDGCQMTSESADAVYGIMNTLDLFDDVKVADYDQAVAEGKIVLIRDEIYPRYLDKVYEQRVDLDAFYDCDVKVVYTPLNGTGNKPVRMILDRVGLKNVTVVPEQEMPDGNFTTCTYPNPEFKEALQLGLDLCEKVHPDILLATDPDADRVGTAVFDGEKYVLLTGNEMGVLLLDYIAGYKTKTGTMPKDPIVVKSIVTTKLADAVAKEYGVELVEVLTGFKYIGEQILLLEQKNQCSRYLFGFEESYGYLSGTYVRDKDAVVASMLICEMVAHYKKQGITLAQKMEEIYRKYGRYLNSIDNFAFEGAAGMQKMGELMEGLRKDNPSQIAGWKVVRFVDYKTSQGFTVENGAKVPFAVTLPTSNVLEYNLENGSSVIVRPSGTEPKIKLYYTAKGADLADAQQITKALSQDSARIMGLK